jgi:hypothetical protein
MTNIRRSILPYTSVSSLAGQPKVAVSGRPDNKPHGNDAERPGNKRPGAGHRELVGLLPVKERVEEIATLLLVDWVRQKFASGACLAR